MGNSYQTVFELGFRSLPWVTMGGPIFFIGISLLLIVFSRFVVRKTFFIVSATFIGSIATIVFLVLLISIGQNFFRLRNAYVSGQSRVVQGVVTNFQPSPKVGPANESFMVEGVLFKYNALDDSPCFRNTPIHHGPIREGLNVRIDYNNECIQRLDVLQEKSLYRPKP